jgi:glyoxylase-like metal-dependent hydrolase (beta-lactamase superfamily II)
MNPARLLVPFALLAAAPAAAQPAQPLPEAALAPFKAKAMAPGIHLLAVPPDTVAPAIGNVTAIEQRDGVVLIDTGGLIGDGRRVVAYVRSITSKPVKAVVITHWHGDHPGGIAAIRAAWPRARVISTRKTRENLTGAGAQEWKLRPSSAQEVRYINQSSSVLSNLNGLLRDPKTEPARRARAESGIANFTARMGDIAGTHYVLPTETFTERLLLDDPDRPVELLFLGRANTDGDAIAWLPRQRVVVTGDVVVSPTPYGFFSFPEDWLGVIDRLKALNFAVLIPGHGDPQTDTAYLDKLAATIIDIRTQVGALARQGLSLEEVRKKLDFSKQTGIFGTTPRLKATFEAFWLTPMVANAYREATGKPIVQGDGDGST